MQLENNYIYIPACSVGAYGIACTTNKRFLNNLPLRYYTTEMDSRLYHPWFLATAGHFYKKENYRELLGADEKSIILGDSGGFAHQPNFKNETIDSLHIPHRTIFEEKMAINSKLPKLIPADYYLEDCYELSDFQECNQRFNAVLSLHNISIFLDASRTVSELIKHPYILEQSVKSTTLDAIKLIRNMISHSENDGSAESYISKNNMLIDVISTKLASVDVNTEHDFF